ncbi:uncharacterized protein LOC144122118 [Amblyomma americanum]
MYKEQTEDYKRREAERLMQIVQESLEGDRRQDAAEEEREHPPPRVSKDDTSHAAARGLGHQERLQGDGVGCERGYASLSLSTLSLGEAACRTGTEADESVEEENWELDITPWTSRYIPRGHGYFQWARHCSRRTRRRMYKEQTVDYKRREAERLMQIVQESLEGDRRQDAAEEEREHPPPRIQGQDRARAPRVSGVEDVF